MLVYGMEKPVYLKFSFSAKFQEDISLARTLRYTEPQNPLCSRRGQKEGSSRKEELLSSAPAGASIIRKKFRGSVKADLAPPSRCQALLSRKAGHCLQCPSLKLRTRNHLPEADSGPEGGL